MLIEDLKKEFASEQKNKKKQQPFLLLELANGKENAHTRVLTAILNFRNHMFLPSFLKMFDLDYDLHDLKDIEIQDQESAVGLKPKSTGFIDLSIKFNYNGEEHRIVIENKVFGANDSEHQLNRYIASIKQTPCNNKKEFDDWINKLGNYTHDELKNDLKNCHIAYLTLEGGEPGVKSLNDKLKECIDDYRTINYVDNIIPWIRESVLKECPYHDGGVTIAGLIQYLAALERLYDNTGDLSESVQRFVKDMKDDSDSKKYKEVLKAKESIRLQKENKTEFETEYEYSDMLWAELKRAAEGIYSNDVKGQEPWILHFTPSFMCLYKPDWMNIGKRKYSIPFVHLYFPNVISKNQDKFSSTKWKLAFEHLDPNQQGLHGDDYHGYLGNKNKTVGVELNLTLVHLTPDELDIKNKREEYFRNVIKEIEPIAGIVDKHLAEIRNKQLENDYEIAFELLTSVFPEIKNMQIARSIANY